MRKYDNSSRVEEVALRKSGKAIFYPPTEKIKTVEVPDFPSLGKLSALRFLEWLQLNPEGVVSLPTGKTPEHFINWTRYFLRNWNEKEVRRELAEWRLDLKIKPKIDSFYFIQIDEFFPMNPAQENSFASYINRFYFGQFGFNPKKALLMNTWNVGTPAGKDLGWIFPQGKVDLSLRFRKPANDLERRQYRAITTADQFAMEYESRIEEMGGIGFFLGGIGPDGHIGFNIMGSDHYSTTRLIPINYETAAAAATDLGGIELARQKVVMTVGLRTITRNSSATVLITAAGESKAGVVKDAIENEPSVLFPATALQGLTGARFYLTKGAASFLTERRCEELAALPKITYPVAERILVDIAVRNKKRIRDLKSDDLAADRLGKIMEREKVNLKSLSAKASDSLRERIERGARDKDVEGLTFLHTAPHHDDIMLGYFPYMVHLVRSAKNTHYFATLTSGFTSVTNFYTLSLLENLDAHLEKGDLSGLMEQRYFSSGNLTNRNRDVYHFLDGVATNSQEMQKEAEARRTLRNLIELTGNEKSPAIRKEVVRIRDYFQKSYPGKKDASFVQILKGMIREWEEELLWGHLGFKCDHIFHLRLGFYTGDIFTPQPEWKRDVKPILQLMEKVEPDVLTVALDPEASGPDTHYKVLQAVSEALKEYRKKRPGKKIRVWGYRNVWFRFHPSEVNLFVPVSMNSLAIMRSAFHTCFGSQRSASFPSYEYDGPFCDLAQKIMVEQFSAVKTCLGREYFYTNPVPRLRACHGLNFLREMTPEEFFLEALSLKKRTES